MAKRRSDQKASRRRDRAALLGLAMGVTVLLGAAGLWRGLLAPADPAIGGPFALTDPDGRQRGPASFPGRYELIFFGYTECADFCPRTLSEMSEALDALDPSARRIQPLFVTIDPRRDTPDRLRRYTAHFSPTLIGLTGTPDALATMRRSYQVEVEPDSGSSPADPQFDHTAALYLLDPSGRVVALIPAAADRDAIVRLLRAHVGALAGA